MAKPARLKVYRTPIGFHDAYVAAPSQKAALAAWGSDHDLFGRGVAEIVTDPDLSAEPLSRPGAVIKRLRGTTTEQIAALPADRPKADRSALDAAEQALVDLETVQAKQERDLAERERKLASERRTLEGDQATERKRLARTLDSSRSKYNAAIKAWRG